MDYSRWENRYRLNESGSVEKVKKMQPVQKEASSGKGTQQRVQTANKTQNSRQMSEEEKRRRQKAARDARARQASAQANKKTRAEYGAEKPRKKTGLWIVILIFFIGFLANLAEEAFDNFSVSDFRDEIDVWDYEEEEYEYDYDYDPYAYVVDEMPEEGDYFEIDLGKGAYYGGKQLPGGVYTVTLINEEDYGNVGLQDSVNLIYYFEYLDAGETTVLEDVRLYEGTQIEIEGNLIVHLESGNAQIDTMEEAQENPLTETVSMTDTIVCGVDFEPGVYDVRAVCGYGTVTDTMAEQEDYTWYTWLDNENEKESVYVNKEFLEGDTLAFDEYSSEDFAVELVPSAEIYP